MNPTTTIVIPKNWYKLSLFVLAPNLTGKFPATLDGCIDWKGTARSIPATQGHQLDAVVSGGEARLNLTILKLLGRGRCGDVDVCLVWASKGESCKGGENTCACLVFVEVCEEPALVTEQKRTNMVRKMKDR